MEMLIILPVIACLDSASSGLVASASQSHLNCSGASNMVAS